jgi:hypothetical protein
MPSAMGDRGGGFSGDDADESWKEDEDADSHNGDEADVDFDDLDDHQVFALLTDGDDDGANERGPFSALSKG